VVVDAVGNTYVTGQTGSTDFPVASPLKGTLNGPSDAFIAKLSADFAVSSSPASASIAAGDSATYTVTVSPSDGLYGLPVSLACSGAPSLSTCTISPQQLTPASSPVTATVTIVTTAPGGSQSSSLRTLTGTLALFLPLLGLSTGFIRRGCSAKTRILNRALSVLIVLLLVLMFGCSGGSSSPIVNPPPPKPGTPSGTSTITITVTSLSMSHTTSLTLDVM